jgi:glutamine amidotransferase
MTSNVAIIDYGTGNLHSVVRCVERLGGKATVTSDPKEIRSCEKIIFPGVGHFEHAMSHLHQSGLVDELNNAVLIKEKPVLGICLGMALLGHESEEGNGGGLGWVSAECVKFRTKNKLKYKVPHIGWNGVRLNRSNPLFNGIPDSSEFYFLHGYYFKPKDHTNTVAETNYEITFSSVIQKGNIFGVQFHPEKSRDVGSRLVANFLEL